MKVTLDISDLTLIKEVIRKENLSQYWEIEEAKGHANLFKKKYVQCCSFVKAGDSQVHRLVISEAAIGYTRFLIESILEQKGYDIVLRVNGTAPTLNIPEDEICYSFEDIANKLESLVK